MRRRGVAGPPAGNYSPRMPSSGPTRFLALLFALVQLVLTPLATLVDARQERASGAVAVAHVESERSDSCAAAHPADCAICHFLTAPATPARLAAELPDGRAHAAAPDQAASASRGGYLAAAGRPRAPPTTA